MTVAPAVSPHYVRGIKNILGYWQTQTQQVRDDDLPGLNRVHANLLRFVQHGLVVNETLPFAAQLMLQLLPLIERGGHWDTWLPMYERALTEGRALSPQTSHQLWLQRGTLYRFRGDLTQAVQAHRRARTLARRLDDRVAVAQADFQLAEDYRILRQLDRAAARCTAVLRALEASDQGQPLQASVYNTLGIIAMEEGRYEEARDWYVSAATLWHTLGEPTQQARCLRNLAILARQQGAYDQALAHYQKALALLQDTSNHIDRCRVYLSLGSLYDAWGMPDKAEQNLRAAEALSRQGEIDYQLRGNILHNLGNIAMKAGRLAEAEAALRRAQTLWRQTDERLYLANSVGVLGETLAAQGQLAAADDCYREALTLLQAYPDSPLAQRWTAYFQAQRAGLGPIGAGG